MNKDFNDFVSTIDKKQLTNFLNMQMDLYADDNGQISKDKMTAILATNSIATTIAILEKYHTWLHQD